jgi:hypothetical protein
MIENYVRDKKIVYLVDQKWNLVGRNNITLDFDRIYVIPTILEDNIRNIYHDENELVYQFACNGLVELEDYFESVLNEISRQEEILTVYSFCGNKPLEKVCSSSGYYFKYIEVSPFREDMYFKKDLCWFLDSPVMNSAAEGTKRYNKFIEEKGQLDISEPIPPISLMLSGVKRELLPMALNWYAQKSIYKLGVGLPGPRKEINNGWMPDRILAEIYNHNEDLKNSMIIREHPGHNDFTGVEKDMSRYSADFISKCKIIVSAGSNVTVEAMVMGKNVVDFSDIFVSSFVYKSIDDIDKPHLYDDWYINFLFFSVFVPIERLFDREYVAWRKTEPKEYEIFNENLDYFFNHFVDSGITVKDLSDFEKVYEMRCVPNPDRNLKLNILYEYSQTKWRNRKVIICGIGRDAGFIHQIVTNFGGFVEAFLVMDDNNASEFCNLKVIHWNQKADLGKDTVFVISQRNPKVQKDVMLALHQAGYTNIVCL